MSGHRSLAWRSASPPDGTEDRLRNLVKFGAPGAGPPGPLSGDRAGRSHGLRGFYPTSDGRNGFLQGPERGRLPASGAAGIHPFTIGKSEIIFAAPKSVRL